MDYEAALDNLDEQHRLGLVSDNAHAVRRAKLLSQATETEHGKRSSILSNVAMNDLVLIGSYLVIRFVLIPLSL
jgi:hypothetical protein